MLMSDLVVEVGTDLKAQAFLGELDVDPMVGGLVDCTSNYESEADEMMRKSGMELFVPVSSLFFFPWEV